MTTNQPVPFIWRVNYHNEAGSAETFLEIAHEKARQYLRKTFRACRSIRWYRRHRPNQLKTATAARRSADNDIKSSRNTIPIVAHFRVAIGRDRVAASNRARDLAGRAGLTC